MIHKTIDAAAIETALAFRHACKRFDIDRKIPQQDFDLLLEAARLAPSSYGFEQWNIIVVQNEKLRGDIGKVANGTRRGQLATASHFLIFTAKTDDALDPKGEYIKHVFRDIKKLGAVEATAYRLYWDNWAKNDFGLYDSPGFLHAWAARQAYIALGTVMTVAAERGIDSCPIEGFNVKKVSEVLEKYDVIDPTNDQPVVMLALGYRVDPQPTRHRRAMVEVVKTV